MVCKCICSFVVQSLFLFSIFALALLLIPNLPPYASFQESYDAPTYRPLTGRLAVNDKLNNVERWHKSEIVGPEAFAAYNGEIYTTLLSGEVVKLTGEHITPVVKTGKPCRGAMEESICGRPLGLQFDKNGALYVADAYYGIFKVDVKTGRKEVIVSPDTKINGKEPKLFNALAVASNGDIYWSDSSSDFHLDDGFFTSLADGTGRLVYYDSKTKRNKVLIDKLRFANGVVLSEDESEVLVAELFNMRVLRYYLKGPKAGKHDVFIDGLPGFPDNLNHDGKGGYLIPLLLPADPDHPSVFNVFNSFPLVRKLVARVLGVTKMVFEMIDRAYPNDYSLRAIHFIGHYTSASLLYSNHRSSIVHVSKTGEILDSIHTTTKPISVSEAFIHKDTLYLGSPFHDHVGRIKLAEVGWAHLAQVDQKRAARAAPAQQETTTTPKPTTTTPKPTTTTPKPTTTTPKPTTTTPKPTTTTKPTTTAKPTTPRPVTQQTAPPTQKQSPPPVKPTTAPPQQERTKPAPPRQATTAAPPKQTPPPPTNAPPTPKPAVPKQATKKPQVTTPPVQKQTPPTQKEAPKQTPPPVVKQAPAAGQGQQRQAPPAAQQQQQNPPPVQKQTTPPIQKQAPPPAQKQAPPPAEKQTPPPTQQTTPPPTKAPPVKEAPKQATPQAKSTTVPVKETVKTR